LAVLLTNFGGVFGFIVDGLRVHSVADFLASLVVVKVGLGEIRKKNQEKKTSVGHDADLMLIKNFATF
jgi:hypothetical protein